VFLSGRFQEIAIFDNITAVRKVEKRSLVGKIRDYGTLALRGVYIAARKSHVPFSKPIGRYLLKTLTNQSWMPVIFLAFTASIAR
ncbi:MAG TPA: hypothetical protein VJ646_00985, partial [Candidatus Binatia bacterium]|nr:hypothetical protein [Candidatus Binatia bacterium]